MSYHYRDYPAYYTAQPYKPPLEPPRQRWGLRRTSASLKPSHWQARPSISASLYCHTPRTRDCYPAPHHHHHHSHSHHHTHHHSHHQKSHLTSLPPELHFNILSSLSPVSSTCYGLSSRHLYPLHHSKHPKVSLYSQSEGSKLPLAFRLREWMPKGYVLDWGSEKFVRKERLGELERERKRAREQWWDERKQLWVWDDPEMDKDRGSRRHRRSSRRY